MRKRKIQTVDGNLTVESVSCGVPGLSLVKVGNRWNVSHNASGRAVLVGLTTERDAELAAKKLKPLADWTKGSMSLSKDTALREKMDGLKWEIYEDIRKGGGAAQDET